MRNDIGGHDRAATRQGSLFAGAIAAAVCVVFLLSESSATSANGQIEEQWAGHQVVWGAMDVPFLGERRTRSETFVLAKVRRQGNRLRFSQRACAVRFKKVAGAQVSIEDALVRALPAVDFEFEVEGGVARAPSWKAAWGRADVDKDGNPGMSIHVDAPLCDGVLYVATTTVSLATGYPLENGLAGEIAVRMRQDFLGADALCLRLFGKDRSENQRGRFVYKRVSPKETCESLMKKSWPVRASLDPPPKRGKP